MSARNKAVVQRINDALARNDVEAFLAECHDDFDWTMVGHETVRGKHAIRNWMKQAPPEPPSFTVDDVVAEGDMVAVIGAMTMKENGTTVPYAYCDVWRFKGDKPASLDAFVVKTAAKR